MSWHRKSGTFERLIKALTDQELEFLGSDAPAAQHLRFFAWILMNWPYPAVPWHLLIEPLQACLVARVEEERRAA